MDCVCATTARCGKPKQVPPPLPRLSRLRDQAAGAVAGAELEYQRPSRSPQPAAGPSQLKRSLQTRVVFHKGLRCFYDTQEKKRLKGAAKLLAQTFWPTYSFRRAPKSGVPSEHGASAKQGRARGIRVDRMTGR